MKINKPVEKRVVNENLVTGFKKVLQSMPKGEVYLRSLPRRVDDLAVLSNDEVNSIYLNEVGETSNGKGQYYNYRGDDIDFNIENLNPIDVNIPSIEELNNLELFGIDGSSQRLDNPSFHFILARATIVNFRYTTGFVKPYFYTIEKNSSAVIQIDGNIFSNSIRSGSNDHLYSATKNKTKDQKVSILKALKDHQNSYPFLLGYNHQNAEEKSPSAHALGWAVKIMNVLELLCLREIPRDKKFVCIKDGPLFSASSTRTDTVDGLKPLKSWKNGVLLAVSKRIADSRLYIDLLSQFPTLVDHYFPGQNIDIQTIQSLGTDALILPRIIKPGQRTPLIKAVPYNRIDYVTDQNGKHTDLFPLVCYYMRRSKPHNVVRVEVPIKAFLDDPDAVTKAIEVMAWQFELGVKAPLVQLAADERCQLKHEIELLRMQTDNMLADNNLDILNYY